MECASVLMFNRQSSSMRAPPFRGLPVRYFDEGWTGCELDDNEPVPRRSLRQTSRATGQDGSTSGPSATFRKYAIVPLNSSGGSS